MLTEEEKRRLAEFPCSKFFDRLLTAEEIHEAVAIIKNTLFERGINIYSLYGIDKGVR